MTAHRTLRHHSEIVKTSQSFGSLSCIFCHQKKIKLTTKIRFDSVVLPTLLWPGDSSASIEPQIHHLQCFVMHCICSILGVSMWDRQRDTSLRKTTQLQRVSTMLTQRRLRFLGQIMRICEDHPPRKLLVWTPSQGRWSAGGQRVRWDDQMLRDLRSCSHEDSWKIMTQEWSEWTECSHVKYIKEAEGKHH